MGRKGAVCWEQPKQPRRDLKGGCGGGWRIGALYKEGRRVMEEGGHEVVEQGDSSRSDHERWEQPSSHAET